MKFKFQTLSLLFAVFIINVGMAAEPAPLSPTPVRKQNNTSVNSVKKGQVLFNFQAADIQAVVKSISQLTGRNFILDPRVKGKITIISAKPVSRYAAYQIFLSALKAQGFTAVTSSGGITKIIPVGEGKQNASTNARVRRSGGDQMVTHVVIVQHGTATQLVPLLRPLMAPTSQLSAYAPANALVMTDYAQNIRRLLRIVKEIDQPISSEVTVIPLKHASALDLAELISRLQSGRGPGSTAKAPGTRGAQITIIPDLRTNNLLVKTANPGQLKQLKSLIHKLDVAAKTGGNTRVVYLRNAEAKNLAEILRGLLAADSAKKSKKGKRHASFVQADEATNSLIINASDAVYNNLRGVIEKLDIRRAQVFVEALITEISSEKASELGFQWATTFDAGGGGVGAGMINFPTSPGGGLAGIMANPIGAAGLGGFSLAYLGPEITIGGKTVRGLGALARALESTSMANILSTPNILTLDNAEATIVVAKNVPVLTGSYAQSTSGDNTVNPFQTIERQDVGLTLRIKPQISEGGTIKLEIYQEVSTIDPTTTSAANLVTNKRILQTTVLIDDQHTIVLGGLIDDSKQKTQRKVPILGSIPILGALFRYKADTKKKTNLMIFLRPTIIRGREDSRRLTASRYDDLLQRDKKSQGPAAIIKRFAPVNTPPPAGEEKGGLPGPPLPPEAETKTETETETKTETETETETETTP